MMAVSTKNTPEVVRLVSSHHFVRMLFHNFKCTLTLSLQWIVYAVHADDSGADLPIDQQEYKGHGDRKIVEMSRDRVTAPLSRRDVGVQTIPLKHF